MYLVLSDIHVCFMNGFAKIVLKQDENTYRGSAGDWTRSSINQIKSILYTVIIMSSTWLHNSSLFQACPVVTNKDVTYFLDWFSC